MKPFVLTNESKQSFPVVVSLPHSGTWVPPGIRRRMMPGVLPNADWFLPELTRFFCPMGITAIASAVSRYVVDLNRSLTGALAGDYRSLVYEKTTQGRPLYQEPLTKEEIHGRIESYYLPYRRALEKLLEDKLAVFSKVYLFDLHSFYLNFTREDKGDILLSDQDHRSASPGSMRILRTNLEAEGFAVTENSIKGGAITREYGGAFDGRVEAIQVEIRYTAYLEDRFFGEEEVTTRDEKLFRVAGERLERAFAGVLKELAP